MGELRREKVWDLLTRLWHWSLVVAVSAVWYLGEFMSFSTIRWHFYCGYVVLGLLAVRLLWGLVGPPPIRLRALLPAPSAVFAYAKTLGRRAPSGTRGHNPLGALSVLAMLLVLLMQATSGLFIESDDYFEAAPLAHLVSDTVTAKLIVLHKFLGKVILALVALHVAAIGFYLVWKRENLVRPMLTGWKWVK